MSLCSMQETKEIFEKAKELINAPEKWIRGAYCREAMNDTGDMVGSCLLGFCTLGSLLEASPTEVSIQALSTIFNRTNGLEDYPISVAEWNDAPERTHAEVMSAFDKAIAYCKERQ